ncbi:hypothetical protein OROHE_002567 [Orobanche hederae]
MSCFKFPAELIDKITTLIRRFWWGAKIGENKICWVSWRKFLQRKSNDGLGFRDLESFNLEFLAKQGWRLLLCPNTLLSKALKARYYPNSSFLLASVGTNPSFTWRGIIEAKKFLKKGMGRVINSGLGTLVFDDDWIPGFTSGEIFALGVHGDQNLRVAELINWTLGTWRVDSLMNIFPANIVHAIQQLPIDFYNLVDKWKWRLAASGRFSVRSMSPWPIIDFGTSCESSMSLRAFFILLGELSTARYHLWTMMHGVASLEAVPVPGTSLGRVQDGDGLDSSPKHFYTGGLGQRIGDVFDRILGTNRGRPVGFCLSPAISKSRSLSFIVSTTTLTRSLMNRAIFEGVAVDDVTIFRSAATLLADFVNSKAWLERSPNPLATRRWLKLPAKGFRLHFDGATSRTPGGGTGVFLTKEEGDFLHGAIRYYDGVSNPGVMELLSLRDALILVNSLHLHSYSLLGDSQNAILAVINEAERICYPTA